MIKKTPLRHVPSQLGIVVAFAAALLCIPTPGFATPILGSALATFAVLGATPNVTNTGATTLTGDVGVSPALSITGLATITVNGTNGAAGGNPSVHLGDVTAIQAQLDLVTAMTNLGLLGAGTLLPADLVGLTIFPGVFTVPAGTTNLSGAVTLNGLGNANAFWVFQMPSSLITSTGSVVNVINTGTGAGVFWNVGSSATLNGPTFAGNVLASTSLTMGAGVTIVCGRALAHTGNVTMINDTIDIGTDIGTDIGCGSNGFSGSGLDFVAGTGVVDTTTRTVVSVPGTAVPEPGTLVLLGTGIAGLVARRRRSARGQQRDLAPKA